MNENVRKQVLIVKRSGEREPFSEAKLRKQEIKFALDYEASEPIFWYVFDDFKG